MILGIDFGTCYTSVTAMNGLLPIVLDVDNAGESGVPSQFMYDAISGKELFGVACTTCDTVTYGDDIIKYMKRKVRENSKDIDLTVVSGGNSYTIREIIELYLEYVIKQAEYSAEMTEKFDDTNIEKVVITAPVGISNGQMTYTDYNSLLRNVIMKATGLDESKVIVLDEPVAAAVSYLYRDNLRKQEYHDKQNVMVFDLGGGTLDVSIVEHNPKDMSYSVKAKEGCLSLGGNDWDNAFMQMILEKARVSLEDDGLINYELCNDVVRLKHLLSTFNESKIIVGDKVVNVSRSEFERATENLLDEAMDIVDRVFNQYEGKIDKIILVGGSSAMPQIKNRMVNDYAEYVGGEDNIFVFNPSKAISNGAAIYGKLLDVRTVSFENISNCTYGFDCRDSRDKTLKIYNMIFKNDEYNENGEITSNAKDTFHATNNDVSCFDINIYESQKLQKDCDEGCWQSLEDAAPRNGIKVTIPIPEAMRGKATEYLVKIKFVLSRDGILDILVTDMDGKRVATGRGNIN